MHVGTTWQVTSVGARRCQMAEPTDTKASQGELRVFPIGKQHLHFPFKAFESYCLYSFAFFAWRGFH